MINMFFSRNKILLLILLVFLIIVVFIISLFLQRTDQPSQIPANVYPKSGPMLLFDTQNIIDPYQSYLGVEVGKTKESGLGSIPNLIKTTPKDNTVVFEYKSSYTPRNNLIVTENKIVAFKSVVTINSKSETPKIEDYLKIYGEPEYQFTGSRTWNESAITAVFPSKGVAFIYNPQTSEVFEVQNFIPLPIEQYTDKFGSDFKDFPTEEPRI